MIENFHSSPDTRWEFISDQVMGGVSTGQVSFSESAEEASLRLQGSVSTENNGGFIQARLKLKDRLPESAQGIELEVRGNDQQYFVHARTTGTLLPWHYYQAPFETSSDWTLIRLPFTAFKAEGWLLSEQPSPDSITSFAVVAFGRKHSADVSIRNLSFY
ncbi:CIA30 family protein [Rhodovibrionaceae bacterium A322]